MTRLVSLAAFATGAMIIFWMTQAVASGDLLAVTVMLLIAVAYTAGGAELLAYQRATESLRATLEAGGSAEETSLETWLAKLPDALKNSVRQRLTGESVGLPAPVLTPYLVGLLVMLGLMGTFVGMVETLSGAVQALEGSTELSAIRAGLAVPIQGLGLAFGTSVAGVAASAMLGLIAVLSRRDRIGVTRELDRQRDTRFKAFSLNHQRQQSYSAIQAQAEALPSVVEKLAALSDRLSAMGEQMVAANDSLGSRLLSNQETFEKSVREDFRKLTEGVADSLMASLVDSGKKAGETVKPVVEQMIGELAQDLKARYQQLDDAAATRFENMDKQFAKTTEAVESAWQQGLAKQQEANSNIAQRVTNILADGAARLVNESAERNTAWQRSLNAQREANEAMLERMQTLLAESASRLETDSAERASQWQTSVESQRNANEALLGQVQTLFVSAAEQSASDNASRNTQWHEGIELQRSANAALIEQIAAVLNSSAQQMLQDNEAKREAWQQALDSQLSANEALIEKVNSLLSDNTELMQSDFESRREENSRAIELQLSANTSLLSEVQNLLRDGARQLVEEAQSRSGAWQEGLAAQQASNAQLLGDVRNLLSNSAEQLAVGAQLRSDEVEALNAQLLAQQTAQLEAQQAAAISWQESFNERTTGLMAAMQAQHEQLQALEMARGEATANQLESLQANVAQQLAELGQSLGAPLGELIESSSEAPRVAAELMAKLRDEMSAGLERDNNLMAERNALLEDLQLLTMEIRENSASQREALELLLTQSGESLEKLSERVGTSLGECSEQLAGTASEFAGFSEGFATAVAQFAENNSALQSSLENIVGALSQSGERSDEQMGYYVAQAREIIDHNLLSQQAILEKLEAVAGVAANDASPKKEKGKKA